MYVWVHMKLKLQPFMTRIPDIDELNKNNCKMLFFLTLLVNRFTIFIIWYFIFHRLQKNSTN